jgi:hypothetical protein
MSAREAQTPAPAQPREAERRSVHTSAGAAKTERMRKAVATKSKGVKRCSLLSKDFALMLPRVRLTPTGLSICQGQAHHHSFRQARSTYSS